VRKKWDAQSSEWLSARRPPTASAVEEKEEVFASGVKRVNGLVIRDSAGGRGWYVVKHIRCPQLISPDLSFVLSFLRTYIRSSSSH